MNNVFTYHNYVKSLYPPISSKNRSEWLGISINSSNFALTNQKNNRTMKKKKMHILQRKK